MSVKELTSENFDSEIINSGKTCLVDFYATWCGPCKMMSPVVDEIAEENEEIIVGKVDVDEAPDIAMRYGVMSIPTLLVIKNGEVADTFVGVTAKNELVSALS